MEGKEQAMISQLPPGFRFHPTDQELINCYLAQKIFASLPSHWNTITDIELYKFNPWELPGKAFFGEGEWFFFSPRERKYPNGVRPNRAAGEGYWKATGTDKPIMCAGSSRCIGVKKNLVFYTGRPRKGIKTGWVMHEYRLLDSILQSQKQKGSKTLDDWVLCRVRQKGNLAAANKEVAETCSPTETSFTVSEKSEEKLDLAMNNATSFCEWNENQPFEWQGIGEVLDPAFEGSFQLCENSDFFEAQQCSSALKRKQSFDVVDELMLLQPAKRLQCSKDGLFFQAESFSLNECFPDFFFDDTEEVFIPPLFL